MYRSERIGLDGEPFTVYKLRTMRRNASSTGVDTTSANDPRLLRGGSIVRRLKIDEIPQVWNILNGTMSIVGPRPNVPREVAKYTDREQQLLSVVPGLTDLSSVALSDLANLVADLGDANEAYEEHIRPAKAALSLYHIDQRSLTFDAAIIGLTAIAVVSPPKATSMLKRWMQRRNAEPVLDHLDRLEGLRNR